MNKKVMKMISIVLIAIMMISIGITSLAVEWVDLDTSGVKSDKINAVGGDIVGILQAVGVVLSIVILIVIGIKYMMGSAEEKADYKKSLMPYIIGACLIFAASAFARAIFDFFTGIN